MFGVFAIIDQRDGQARADRDALLAARAALGRVGDLETGQTADVVRMDMDQIPRADRRAGIAGDFLDAVEDGEDAAFFGRNCFGHGLPGPGFQDLGRRIPIGGDLADVVAQGAGDLQAPDLAGEDGGRSLGDLLGVARGEGRQAEFPRLDEELVDRIEPDGDEDRVAGERPFRARGWASIGRRAGRSSRTRRMSLPLALRIVCEV